MKILVIGKNGQLGKSIQNISYSVNSNYDFTFIGRKELDLSNNNAIVDYLDNYAFDIIINCAAYNFVDKAEKEREAAVQINHLAVKKIAEIANKKKIILLHVSTDYVFDGNSEALYNEDDKTNAVNFYGKSKLAGEQAILLAMPFNALIIRTSWVYSEYSNNFVDTIFKLSKNRKEINVVDDQIGSPTYAGDLAMTIFQLIEDEKFHKNLNKTQIYHYSNLGNCSWFDFAKEITQLAKLNIVINPISSSNYPTAAVRPRNTLMSKDKISDVFDIQISDWQDSLKFCIKKILSKKISK
jgi:dTDP-4-dehydrorhamnose reductase